MASNTISRYFVRGAGLNKSEGRCGVSIAVHPSADSVSVPIAIAGAAPYSPADDSVAVEIYLDGMRKARLKQKFGWGTGLPKLPREGAGKPGRFFTAEQVRSILALALEPWFTIFALAAMTGLRPGEVLGLSIDDLDFEQRLIFVRRSAWYSHLISPKSKRSMATVPIPGPLAEILTNFRASWRPNEKRLLFSNRRGNPYSENKVVQKRLWPILDVSIPRCGMHAFRHAHGTLMQSNEVGASVKATQDQLRHADAGTTMNLYVHGIPSEQRDASEKLARILCPNVAEMRSDVAKSEKKSMHVN
jgi:integrase